MPLQAVALYQLMLSHINKRLGGATQIGQIPDGVPEYALDCMIGALEIMRERAPAMFTQNIGVTFRGPRTGTVSATDGESSFFLGTLLAPQNGETILIGGDAIHNEAYYVASENGDYQLVQAYSGAGGTQSATLFGDCVQLTVDADRILGNVFLPGRRELGVVNNRMDFALYPGWSGGDYGSQAATPNISRRTGVPEVVWLETWNHPDATSIEYRLHCSPFPSGEFPVRLDVVIKPQEPGLADIVIDSTFTFAVPGGRDRTILKPIVLYLWSESPWFAPPPELRRRIEAGYTQAIAALDAFRPNASAGGQIVVRG